MEIRWIYMTAPNVEEARRIGRMLVERRLAACVNILKDVESIYWWNGSLEEGTEAVLIAKTTTARVPELTAAVKAIHSYQCPCVVSLSIESGNPDFLAWIRSETRPEKS